MRRVLLTVLLLGLPGFADDVAGSCVAKLTNGEPWRAELLVDWDGLRPPLPFHLAFSPQRLHLSIDDGRTWYVDGDVCTFSDGQVCLLLDTGPFFSTLEEVAGLAEERFGADKRAIAEAVPRRVPTVEVRFGGDSNTVTLAAGLRLDFEGRNLHASWIEDLEGSDEEAIAGLYMVRDDHRLLAVNEETGFLHELVSTRADNEARVRTVSFAVEAQPFAAPTFTEADTLQIPGRMRSEALAPFLTALHGEVLGKTRDPEVLSAFWTEAYGRIYAISFADTMVRFTVGRAFRGLEEKLTEIAKLVGPEHYELGLDRMSGVVVEAARRSLLGEARTISLAAEEALERACRAQELDANQREQLLRLHVEALYRSVEEYILAPARAEAERAVEPLLKGEDEEG